MSTISFILFMFGVISEFLLLFDAAGRAYVSPAKSLADKTYQNPIYWMIAALGVIALLLIGLFNLLGIAEIRVYIDTPGVMFIFIILGLCIMAAGALPAAFVPPINEQTILIVQGVILLGALWQKQSIDWLPVAFITVVPALVSLILLVWRGAFPPVIKVWLYLWYLCSLIITPFLNGQAALFRALDFTWFESLAFGMVFIFLLTHAFFTARFLLIASSLILPRNHPRMNALMPHIFFDDQVPILRFSLSAALAILMIIINHRISLIDPAVMLSLAVMVCVQILGWRPIVSG